MTDTDQAMKAADRIADGILRIGAVTVFAGLCIFGGSYLGEQRGRREAGQACVAVCDCPSAEVAP